MDQWAQDLAVAHLGLTYSIALQVYRTAPHALDLDELRGIANLGLTTAVQRWRPYCRERGFSPDAMQYFKPFLVRRVYGALMDAIRASDWAPRQVRTRSRALQAAGQDRGATHSELAERTGLSEADIRSTVRRMAQRPVSLDAEGLDLGAVVDVESSAFTRTVLGALVLIITALPVEQQIVLSLHYHLGVQLQQVARDMHLPEGDVSELHARAVLAVRAGLIDAAGFQE